MSDSVEAIICYHEKYWAIAARQLDEIRQVVSRREGRIKAGVRTFEEINALLIDNTEIERLSLIVVVFSALTAEAYINHYAVDRTSKSFLNNYLDRLDPVSKWIIIPRLVTGRQIDTGCRAIGLYKKLIALRNKLVHWKTQKKPISELKEEDWVTEHQAELAISAVKELIMELQRIDPKTDSRWLEETPSKF